MKMWMMMVMMMTEVEDDDVEDDDVKGEEEDDVENDDIEEEEMILRMPMRRRTTDPKTALRVLREPAQSKCTWTFHKSYFVSRRFTSGSKSSATDSSRHRLGCHKFTCVRTWLLDAKAEKRRFSSTF